MQTRSAIWALMQESAVYFREKSKTAQENISLDDALKHFSVATYATLAINEFSTEELTCLERERVIHPFTVSMHLITARKALKKYLQGSQSCSAPDLEALAGTCESVTRLREYGLVDDDGMAVPGAYQALIDLLRDAPRWPYDYLFINRS